MKVTCGSCFRTLVVEDWLADNVARCPKCNEVIRLPAKGSVAGANAVVLTVEEATELLRRRSEAGQVPTIPPRQAAAGERPGGGGGVAGQSKSSHPKTEPLPAFLRHASASIHEEPEHRKTKPLPRPAGRPSPILGPSLPPPSVAGPLREAEAHAAGGGAGSKSALAGPGEEQPRKFAALATPLVPIAFIAGVMIGAVLGWAIARAVGGRAANPPPGRTADGTSNSAGQESTQPPLAPTVAPTPERPEQPRQPDKLPAATAPTMAPPQPTPTPSVPAPAPQFAKDKWLVDQPKAARAEVVGVSPPMLRAAGVTDGNAHSSFLYWPAPEGMVYLQVRATLKWTEIEPVTLHIGGPNSDCWLVTNGGKHQVYDALGAPATPAAPAAVDPGPAAGPGHPDATTETDAPPTFFPDRRPAAAPAAPPAAPDRPVPPMPSSPANPASVTLDKSNPKADVTCLFLVPITLPEARLEFSHCQFANLGSELREPDPLVSGRTIAGRWSAVRGQDPAAVAAWAAMIKSDKAAPAARTDLTIGIAGSQPSGEAGGKGFTLTIDKAGITAMLRPATPGGEKTSSGLFDAKFKLADSASKAEATVRLFNGGWQMLIYLGGDHRTAVAFQRYEQRAPWED